MTKESEAIYNLKSPWAEHAHNVWLASVLGVSRNLTRFKFPAKLDKSRQEQALDLIYSSMQKCESINAAKLYRAEQIDILEKEYLLEHFLATEDFYQAHGQEGFITDETSSFLAVANLKDHLLLRVVDTQQELEKSWNRLVKIEGALSSELDFAYNSQFGFLTSDPRRCGTALNVHLYLHIPATIHMGELSELLDREKEEEVNAVGLQGNVQEVIGDILVATNNCTIGLTEEYILTSMRMWATRAVVTEVNLRKKLVQGGDEGMKNKITRALGLLTHSYQLELIEALNAISLVKLGVEIGWIKAPENLNLNDVLFGCRRAHLIHQMKEKIEIPELPKKRAQYLQNIAALLELSI
ncbi:MAG: Protein-arginine kinase [Chlamydiales bacterium]|nr:Protein-arginine kinase [Chlamydiales bacterium]MCH9636240.1 Protein-arginine kinase [Chlamydiales bacterium]MCH9703714.1 protein arginine kinase [Chlamydiota bacterium]